MYLYIHWKYMDWLSWKYYQRARERRWTIEHCATFFLAQQLEVICAKCVNAYILSTIPGNCQRNFFRSRWIFWPNTRGPLSSFAKLYRDNIQSTVNHVFIFLAYLMQFLYHYRRKWTGRRWPGSRWPGSRWPGSRWTGSRWTGIRWTGSRRTGSLTVRYDYM